MCLKSKHISTFDNAFAIDQVKKPWAYAQAERLGRGVNLGNALEAPNEGDWGMVIQEDYFQHIKTAGFDTIGVPIRWSSHALEEPPYTIEKTFFERVDWVEEWFIRYNQDFPDINPAGPKPIMEALDKAVAWSEKHSVPLWMGEFGAYKKADMQSRVNWTKFVREQAEVRNIPWAYWEFGAEFGVYDRRVQDWNKGLLEALIPIEGKDHLTIFHPSESLIYQGEDLYHKSKFESFE